MVKIWCFRALVRSASCDQIILELAKEHRNVQTMLSNDLVLVAGTYPGCSA